MTDNDHLLICLAEECAEISEQCARISVRVSKALRFGNTEVQPGQLLSNVERIAAELADLLAVVEMLQGVGVIKREQVEKKMLKLAAFISYSRQCGTLENHP